MPVGLPQLLFWITCAVPGMAQAKYVVDNLGAARGRLPDAATRRKMEQFIDNV